MAGAAAAITEDHQHFKKYLQEVARLYGVEKDTAQRMAADEIKSVGGGGDEGTETVLGSDEKMGR